MPNPRRGPPRSDEPEDEELKGVKVELGNAEKRFEKLLEKRNELNHAALELRNARDAINDQKRHLVAEIRRLQAERDERNLKAREHRDRRNTWQGQAKQFIEIKRKARANTRGGYGGKVRELDTEIKALLFKQETTPMSVAKENELLKKVTELRKELEVAKVQYADEAKLLADVKDLDAKIDELFRQADEEHKFVVEHSNAAQALHDQIEPLVKELRFLDQESDAKHQGFLAARAQADEIHAKMQEMRGKVVELRGTRSAIFHERRQIIQEQNTAVRQALEDPAKLDERADEAVKALLEKKKISL